VQPSKTLWDVLQLLIVPAILSESASRGTAIEQMSDLMLTKNLLRSKPFSAVRSVARTATLTTLSRVDGERRSVVVCFLEEARLI